MPMSGPVRPGSYDFAFHAWFDRLGAVGFFYRNPELRDAPPGSEVTELQRAALWIEDIRLALAERVRAQIGGAEGEIAATLIAGIRAGIPEADDRGAAAHGPGAHIGDFRPAHGAGGRHHAAWLPGSPSRCFPVLPHAIR